MCVFEQLNTLEKNISNVKDPALLFAMNQKARELESKIDKLKELLIHY